MEIWCHQDFVPSTWFHRFGSKTRCIRKTRERGRTWNQINVIRDKAMVGLRSAAVDSSGREFNRNRLIALLSAIFLEQIRVSGFGGWFLLRLSLHDPFLPLNIEAQSEDDAVKLGLVVANAVKEFNALDTSALSSLTRS
ncbi:uncharacterized protein BNAC05G36900D isoform X1 [Brassica napus]|uniref:uncharacterized protein BNAC05G36900D isoform X1 n=2 Tax=Brassica napus TaxID=3708 RepID=UPI0006AB414C|nr:uncharacterized protein BNAC05G36900D isoform X1 [Brassica napus]